MPKGTTKKTHRYNFGRLKLFIVVGVLIYVLAFMANHQGDVAAQIKRQDELTKTQTELEQQVQYYTNELEYIGTDEYVEQEARNRFGWLKDGEIKYVEGNGASAGVEASTATMDPVTASSVPAAPTDTFSGGSEGITASGSLSN